MALRTPALWMGNPAVQHPAQNDRLLLSSLLRPEVGQTAANRPLAGSAGVLAGPAGTMGEVTLLSNTQFTVNPARWYCGSSASALGGVYQVTNDAVATLSITAQDATQSRKSYWAVWVTDSFVAGSGDDLPHWGLIDGALAASNPQLPAAGALPANALLLGEFLIPPVGQAVTFTPYEVRTGMRGGILPVTATDARSGAYVGQYRDSPTVGPQRWNGTLWKKIPGIPLLVASNEALGGTSGVAPGGTGFPVTNQFTIPAHAPGELMVKFNVGIIPGASGTIAGYAQIFIGPGTTGQTAIGSRTRYHNNGVNLCPLYIQALYDSDGTAKNAVVLIWSDAGSNQATFANTATSEAWLL